MISKQPSRYISQLDLKFLDLRFLTIEEDNPKNSQGMGVSRSENSVSNINHTRSSSSLRYDDGKNLMPSLRGPLHKKDKKVMASEERTTDATHNENDSLMLDNQEINF